MNGKVISRVYKMLQNFIRKGKILKGRFSHLSEIASGTPISVKSSHNRRYVIMTSAICASTHITIDLMDFHTAIQIVTGFTNLHGSR